MLCRSAWVSLCAVALSGCGGQTQAAERTRASEGGERDQVPAVSSAQGADDDRPTPPSIAPRWVAVWTSNASDLVDFQLVRFDDVEQPETVLLAHGAEGEQTVAELVSWSPSGEHFAFVITTSNGETSLWVASAAEGFARRRVSGLPETEIEIVPEQSPKLGRVHVPSDTVVDAHPHGDLVFSNDFGGRALAPEGVGYAYAVHRSGSDLVDAGGRIVMGDTGARIDNGVGHGLDQAFGFLDAERFFYSRTEAPTATESEPRALVALRAEGVERVVSQARYAPRYLDGFAAHERLVFVSADIDRRASLWTVDLSVADAEAEVVPIEGTIVIDSPLKVGEARGRIPGIPAVASAPALLLATSDDLDCIVLSQHCQTGWTVVDFSEGVHLAPLALPLAVSDATWSPDGAAVFAITGDGLHFVLGPAYRGSFPLSANAVAMVVPQRWPTL